MNKKLPFTSDTILKTYPFFTDFFGILQGHGYDVRGTAYNNFIMLAYVIRLDFFFFTAGFPEGRKVRKHFCRQKMPKQVDNMVEYLKENINENKYAIIVLNNLHLSNVPFDREWYHDWMIYGYDDEKELFYAAGTVVDTSCHAFTFKEITISYDELLMALPPSPDTKTNYHQKFMKNCFYRLPETFALEPINLKKIRRNIFLYAYNILPLCFNAKTYRKYAFALRLYHKKNEKSFDLRPFKILQEQKAMILQMMNDLVTDSNAAKEYQTILNLANAIQISALKYNITKRNKLKTLDLIDDSFKKMRVEETRILRLFYRELKGVKK